MTLNPIPDDSQFRTCAVCGNSTPAANPACIHCGAIVDTGAEQSAREAAKEYRFFSALFSRSNPFTMIFIGINVGVFVLMGLAGGFNLTSANPEVLIGFGAKQNDLIANHHQYWRLITSIFIHIGFIHLFLNNYALWIIGQEIEQIYGSARFVVLYLVSGMVGSAGSYVFSPEATSAGASGAIFGLFGVMATFAFKYRKEIPKALSRDIMRRVLPIIAINLAFGFSVAIVDNAAHIGGLLAGIILAFTIPYMRPDEKRAPIVWRALEVVCLLLILVSFVSAFRGYNGPGLSVSKMTSRSESSVVRYSSQIEEADKLLVQSFRSVSNALDSKNPADELSDAVNFVDQGIRIATETPRINAQSEQYRERLMDLLTKQKAILTEMSQSTGMVRQISLDEQALIKQHNQFVSDYGEWWPGFIKAHGYRPEKNNNQ